MQKAKQAIESIAKTAITKTQKLIELEILIK
jgi:hypothetical protein